MARAFAGERPKSSSRAPEPLPAASKTLLRGVLGVLQMLSATTALLLLAWTGVNPWSLGAVVVTCTLTSTSVWIFGSHRSGRRP